MLSARSGRRWCHKISLQKNTECAKYNNICFSLLALTLTEIGQASQGTIFRGSKIYGNIYGVLTVMPFVLAQQILHLRRYARGSFKWCLFRGRFCLRYVGFDFLFPTVYDSTQDDHRRRRQRMRSCKMAPRSKSYVNVVSPWTSYLLRRNSF